MDQQEFVDAEAFVMGVMAGVSMSRPKKPSRARCDAMVHQVLDRLGADPEVFEIFHRILAEGDQMHAEVDQLEKMLGPDVKPE